MNFLERLIENPIRFARIKRWFYVGLATVAVAEIVLPLMFHGDHSHFWFDRLPGWGSLYGVVSCVAILVVSKIRGKAWLMRREDHYDS